MVMLSWIRCADDSLWSKLVTVKVTALNEHASKDNAKGMYEIIEERRLEEA